MLHQTTNIGYFYKVPQLTFHLYGFRSWHSFQSTIRQRENNKSGLFKLPTFYNKKFFSSYAKYVSF
jgi:hypothetical protein